MNRLEEKQKRYKAAEDVCFSLLLMMDLGMLELPMENRKFLAEPMQIWADLAAEAGILVDTEYKDSATALSRIGEL